MHVWDQGQGESLTPLEIWWGCLKPAVRRKIPGLANSLNFSSQNEIAEERVPAFVDQTVSLEELDRPTGVLHVWFLLLEGLAGAVATCPRRYQPHTIDTLFQMFRGLREVPGEFLAIAFPVKQSKLASL